MLAVKRTVPNNDSIGGQKQMEWNSGWVVVIEGSQIDIIDIWPIVWSSSPTIAIPVVLIAAVIIAFLLEGDRFCPAVSGLEHAH